MWLAIKAPALMEPSYETPFPTVVPKANADCEIGKHHASHFLSTFCCSQLTRAITWQACECDKVNLDSTMDRKWILLWWNSNCNHSDKRQIGKTHSRLLGVFSKDKHLFMAWVIFFFFFNQDKIWVLWKMAQAQGFVSQDKENGNSRSGLRQTFREGAVISAVGQGPWAHHSVRCMTKSSTIDASEQKNSEPPHVPLCDDMLLSESQYALAHPLQTVLPNMIFTAPRINVNGEINTKIAFS